MEPLVIVLVVLACAVLIATACLLCLALFVKDDFEQQDVRTPRPRFAQRLRERIMLRLDPTPRLKGPPDPGR